MVDQQEQSRWRPTRKQLLLAAELSVLAFLMTVVFGYLFGWEWTGLPKRTLWDWLDLLIVPFVLALGGYMFTRAENRRAQDLADQRAETDRQIAAQGRQDDLLRAYLDQVGELLLDGERPLLDSDEGDEVRTLARARTLTVLRGLDGERRGRVVQFLHESGLIDNDRPVISLAGSDLSGALLSYAYLEQTSLSGANLSGANLSGTHLKHADLSGANLSGASLTYADLSEANLSRAHLRNTDLSYADLIKADLTRANYFLLHTPAARPIGADLSEPTLTNLSGANLDEATLNETVLNGADLSGANVTDEQLDGVWSLEDATLPDNQKYEDWLKTKGGREE